LPRRIRSEAQALADAAQLSGHPKLARMIDAKAQTRAYRDCKRFLEKIDGTERFVRYAVGLITVNAFHFLVIAVALIAILVWRGYL